MPGKSAARGLPTASALAAAALLNAHLVCAQPAPADQSAPGALPEANAAAAPPSNGAAAGRQVWKTIRLGTIRSIIALREALESNGCGSAIVAVAGTSDGPSCHLGDDANEALGQRAFRLSARVRTIGLVQASAADLGFPAAARPSLTEIYARAERAGLAVCPAEVGPQLRLQYLDQPLGEFLPIAMLPIANYAGQPILFLVGNGGAGLLLAGRNGALDARIPGVTEFVFCAPAGPSVPHK